jgi:hypothetical protein
MSSLLEFVSYSIYAGTFACKRMVFIDRYEDEYCLTKWFLFTRLETRTKECNV